MINKMRKIKRGTRWSSKNNKGLSPVITTVLLIALTIAITAIIFLWFRGMVQEGVTKFGKNIQLVCDDVQFDATYSSGIMNIVNNGNIPLYKMNVKIIQGGSYQTYDVTNMTSTWPETGLTQGGSFSEDISSLVGSANEITILPVLIGTSSSGGKKTFVCGGQYGKTIEI
ncbi:Uncharacterised protein [uncultured archaeon]|nr:Uncharacterised protein [uncultured archaeon]